MPVLEIAVKFGIYAAMGTVLIFALGVVTLRNLFHCALCLAAALIGTAVIYLGLRADFLAGIQILLYVGAVVTLVIFAIMLTEHLAGKTVRQNNSQSLPAVIGLAAFVAILAALIVKTPWPLQAASHAKISVMEIGQALMGTYVFPFEVISVILIAALIGAVVIAKKDNSGEQS
ncbi:MAG TPA: NADH-quinone oxidoreductase subunit J [Candidatus Omnitrophota bacterium]|nr:NADH-quinone oxidoreductase subunit J [Candidatus Omnitrophota bacterium]